MYLGWYLVPEGPRGTKPTPAPAVDYTITVAIMQGEVGNALALFNNSKSSLNIYLRQYFQPVHVNVRWLLTDGLAQRGSRRAIPGFIWRGKVVSLEAP